MRNKEYKLSETMRIEPKIKKELGFIKLSLGTRSLSETVQILINNFRGEK